MSEKDAKFWLEEYSQLTMTNWIVKDGVYSPHRLIYHKTFACQRAKKNKRKRDSERNTGCLAIIDIKIKKVNRGTKKNDAYLKELPPLAAVIRGNVDHNHPINTSHSLKVLRINEETKNCFINFFEDGLGPAESIKQYENKILINSNYKAETMANTAINPTYNIVKHLYDKWRTKNFGHVNDCFEKLEEKHNYYLDQGTKIQIDREFPWAIIIVTPIMQRTQKLQDASEIIFIDSTCSVDAMQSTLTVVLTASPAGALPLCFLIHEGQTDNSYTKAFGLLKLYNPVAFGGKEYPAAFMTDNAKAEKNALRATWPHARQLLCHFHVAQAEWRWLMAKKIMSVLKIDKP